ncbi:MAG: hypothetical protein GXO77_03540 [Calditrichaeota bacterium]|nr:hypothetical protein [Calditrichota bacterium]
MRVWKSVKNKIVESLQVANKKSVRYTQIGRIKIDALSVKKEIEEKFLELGGKVYEKITKKKETDLKGDLTIQHIIEQIKELEAQLSEYDSELKRIKDENGIELD